MARPLKLTHKPTIGPRLLDVNLAITFVLSISRAFHTLPVKVVAV